MVKTEFSHICLGQESVKRASTESQSCEITNKAWLVPYVISLAVRLAVSDEASARLVQILTAFCALQTGCVPLQVRGHPQDVLIVDLTSTADTHGDPRLLWIWKQGLVSTDRTPINPAKHRRRVNISLYTRARVSCMRPCFECRYRPQHVDSFCFISLGYNSSCFWLHQKLFANKSCFFI